MKQAPKQEEPKKDPLSERLLEGTVGFLLIVGVLILSAFMVLLSPFTKKKRPKNPD